ncbi:diguanylate cyclase domain-containing protein [uncultured Deefgea sp.]|uniref:diguanylate cyclase domain-containing protein n=1 Tax=uncultured Deefgea sp. TaxID=1304914 RepID=UPI00260D5FA1|nr:diguanylate cyclase [uncultured Deefgea sp.]
MIESEELNPRPQILIVDDSRIVRATVRKHLSVHFDLFEAADGEAGWKLLLAEPMINLLISDLTMPELDGLGLLARVRSSGDARLHYLPVIIISGEEDEATKLRCVECGANDFITKSTDRTEMLARVQANLELAATRRELAAARAMQVHATSDELTGVASSYLLNLQLEQALAFALRHNSQVSLLLLEVNHFQMLTDKLGERVCGQMLGMLAKLLESTLRKEDTLAHLTGALFAIISPATPLTEAKIVAERLRHRVANARINYREQLLRVTASIAVANSWHDEAHSCERILHIAQDRLYATPMANQVFMPERQSMPHTPLIAEALVMLHKGMTDELRPHLRALLKNLQPLLVLAQQDLALDWDLSQIEANDDLKT